MRKPKSRESRRNRLKTHIMKQFRTPCNIAGRSVILFVTLFWGGLSLWAQPVVQVPQACTVLVAGAGPGALAGPGGKVGDGGVVVMPDPYKPPSGFTHLFSFIGNGASLLNWSLSGDISFNETQLRVSSISSFNRIFSYNKNVRSSENSSPSTGTLARSKGLVRVHYSQPPCDNFIEFEIYKKYPNTGVGNGYVPEIIGPDCWIPNEVVTYSVDPIATDNLLDGFKPDVYYWQVKEIGTGDLIFSDYTSSDGSSITFTTPSPIENGWEITCCYGRANPWDGDLLSFVSHTTCTTKTIAEPIEEPDLVPPVPSCLAAGVTTFSTNVNPTIPGLNYQWNYLSDGLPTVVQGPSPVNSSVSVSGLNNNPGTLVLRVNYNAGISNCPGAMFEYRVEREFGPPMELEFSDECIEPGETLQVSLPAGAQGNLTDWILPSNWVVDPLGSQSSVINVIVPSNELPGVYTISAKSAVAACSTGVIQRSLTVRPSPISVSGPDCVLPNGQYTYTVNLPPGASLVPPLTCNWTIPDGWVLVSQQNNTIDVRPNGITIGEVKAKVCVGTCCDSASKAISYSPQQPTILGPSCFNVGTNGDVVFVIPPPVIPGTYTWTVNPNWGLPLSATSVVVNTASMSSPQICTLRVGTLGISGPIPSVVTVTHSTSLACSSSQPGVFDAPSDNQPSNMQLFLGAPGPLSQTLEILYTAPSSTFQWLRNCGLPNESVCTTCGTGPSMFLNQTGQGGSYGINVILNGCITRRCTTTTHGARLAPDVSVNADTNQVGSEITLSPNPNGGDFELNVQTVKKSGDLIMFDAYGKQVFQTPLQQGVNRFDQKKLANGTYFLRITVDGAVTMKKMEIIH